MKQIINYVCCIFRRNELSFSKPITIMSTFHKFPWNVCFGSMSASASSGHRCYSMLPPLCLKHALLVTKMTRYELECQRCQSEDKSKQDEILKRETYDYDVMVQHHNLHKEFERNITKVLNECGIETRTVNRTDYIQSNIDWADIIIPTGGDGTFLMAASRVQGNHKPVVGFNSDPTRSEGFLCLPVKYSSNVKEAIRKLQRGQFEWLFRSRIRITLEGERIEPKAKELAETRINPTDSDLERVEHLYPEKEPSEKEAKKSVVLPVLALNEVFMAESLSSRVSYLGLSIDDGGWTKVKSSGICVSTGSGSTSWHLSINRITEQSVREVMNLLGSCNTNQDYVKKVADDFNRNLVFKCDDSRMSYTVRDLISAGVWPDPKGLEPRGYAKKIAVKSRCFDGGLVVDGGIFYSFNEGTKAVLEVYAEDALRSVKLLD